jgi:hypothetical protein
VGFVLGVWVGYACCVGCDEPLRRISGAGVIEAVDRMEGERLTCWVHVGLGDVCFVASGHAAHNHLVIHVTNHQTCCAVHTPKLNCAMCCAVLRCVSHRWQHWAAWGSSSLGACSSAAAAAQEVHAGHTSRPLASC